MRALIAALIATTLGACSPASPPRIEVPATPDRQASHAKEAHGLLKAWMSGDDRQRLTALVKQSGSATKEIFANPHEWPDCKALRRLADDMLESGTIYGVTQVPIHYQQSMGMGCSPPPADLKKQYATTLTKILKLRALDIPTDRVVWVAEYLQVQSEQGMLGCAHQSMKLSREAVTSFPAAMSAIRRDCAEHPSARKVAH